MTRRIVRDDTGQHKPSTPQGARPLRYSAGMRPGSMFVTVALAAAGVSLYLVIFFQRILCEVAQLLAQRRSAPLDLGRGPYHEIFC